MDHKCNGELFCVKIEDYWEIESGLVDAPSIAIHRLNFAILIKSELVLINQL